MQDPYPTAYQVASLPGAQAGPDPIALIFLARLKPGLSLNQACSLSDFLFFHLARPIELALSCRGPSLRDGSKAGNVSPPINNVIADDQSSHPVPPPHRYERFIKDFFATFGSPLRGDLDFGVERRAIRYSFSLAGRPAGLLGSTAASCRRIYCRFRLPRVPHLRRRATVRFIGLLDSSLGGEGGWLCWSVGRLSLTCPYISPLSDVSFLPCHVVVVISVKVDVVYKPVSSAHRFH